MKVNELFDKFNTLFDVDNQEWYDNSGAQITFGDEDVSGVFVSLDATPGSAKRAVEAGANVLLTHHPLYFGSGSFLYAEDPNGMTTAVAYNSKLSIYSAHTCFDILALNEHVARLIGMENLARLTEREGYIGDIRPCTLLEYGKFVSRALDEDGIRVCGDNERTVSRVAFINGSGGRDEEMIKHAVKAGADVFVSSEFKHSVIRFALDLGCAVIDVSHMKSELPFVALAGKMLEDNYGIHVVLDGETNL